MSAAYVVADTEVKDAAIFARYREVAPSSVAKFGGQYLAVTQTVEVLMGDSQPERIAVVRFENKQMAHAWWNSEEYREARALRAQMGTSRIFLVEGL